VLLSKAMSLPFLQGKLIELRLFFPNMPGKPTPSYG